MAESFEHAEQAYLDGCYENVSPEELAARVRAAPEMGGSLLVQLVEFVAVTQPADPT
jgi:hypothetical protein